MVKEVINDSEDQVEIVKDVDLNVKHFAPNISTGGNGLSGKVGFRR